MKVFVSYTRRDGSVTTEMLRRLGRYLSKNHEPFIHALEADKLRHQQFGVIKALISSNFVLLIDSPGVNHSPWVKIEIILSRILMRRIIKVPVSVLISKFGAG